jgi:hypothetical protein
MGKWTVFRLFLPGKYIPGETRPVIIPFPAEERKYIGSKNFRVQMQIPGGAGGKPFSGDSFPLMNVPLDRKNCWFII